MPVVFALPVCEAGGDGAVVAERRRGTCVSDSDSDIMCVMKENQIVVRSEYEIQSRILTLRGVQVMLDRDLAELYGVEVKYLNRQVKRNEARFPADFMFQLSKEECLRCQIVTLNEKQGHHLKYLPYAFTENGVAMLSGVLRSERAIAVNIQIMRAFVAMRHALASFAPLLSRIEANERRQIVDQAKNDANQLRNEARFEQIFDAMRDKEFPPQKVFYDGEVFDADAFVTRHMLSAKKSILLIDNWVDVITLEMLAKKRRGVTVEIVTSRRGNRLSKSDVEKFNAQYGGLTIRTSAAFHDRFLIVDGCHLYLFGASLKDLGKKCFAFTKLDAANIDAILAKI